MSRRRAFARSLSIATAVVLVAGALAAPASADTDECPPETAAGEVTRVEGDLRLPPRNCTIRDLVVTGALVVPEGGSLRAVRTVVEGDVQAAGHVVFEQSRVLGGVALAAPQREFWLIESLVRRSVRGQVRVLSFISGFVGGAVNVSATETIRMWRGSNVTGWVNLRGGAVTEIRVSSLGRGATLAGMGETRFCGSEIAADLTITRSHGVVSLGEQIGDVGGCRAETLQPEVAVGGTVRLVDNPHSIRVDEMTVGGDLVCEGNTGPRGVQVLSGTVTVAGARSGQCA
jgi:hypothetical protein